VDQQKSLPVTALSDFLCTSKIKVLSHLLIIAKEIKSLLSLLVTKPIPKIESETEKKDRERSQRRERNRKAKKHKKME